MSFLRTPSRRQLHYSGEVEVVEIYRFFEPYGRIPQTCSQQLVKIALESVWIFGYKLVLLKPFKSLLCCQNGDSKRNAIYTDLRVTTPWTARYDLRVRVLTMYCRVSFYWYHRLILIKEDPIPIYSPRSKRCLNGELTSRNFMRLLLVNKQVAAEASIIFYSKNIWVVGNGAWSSTMETNEHALIAFNERIPNRYKACIKSIKFEIHPSIFALRAGTSK